ncbi:hypothetical protein AABB24_030818, partial [Solanum stoloniferum]
QYFIAVFRLLFCCVLRRSKHATMAPRGRPRKRLSRMDAATDAMTAFGFDERFVQKTVKQLLKEYGGDDGWAFIEEYGYKELIEAILRDQESNDEDSTKQKLYCKLFC